MPALRNGNGGLRLPQLRISDHSEQPRSTQTDRDPEKKTGMNDTCQLIRSNRKTISLELTPTGLVVRAPYAMTKEQIDQFIM